MSKKSKSTTYTTDISEILHEMIISNESKKDSNPPDVYVRSKGKYRRVKPLRDPAEEEAISKEHYYKYYTRRCVRHVGNDDPPLITPEFLRKMDPLRYAVMCEFGTDVEKSLDAAYEIYREYARKGNLDMCYRIYFMYFKDDKYKQALEILIEAFNTTSDSKDADIQKDASVISYLIGTIFEEESKEFDQSFYDACRWYLKSALLGNSDADIRLDLLINRLCDTLEIQDIEKIVDSNKCNSGLLYYPNIKFRLKIYLADKGNVKYQQYMGQCFENGDHVEKSIDIAMEYYLKAAENGDVESQYRYGVLAQKYIPDTKKKIGYKWIKLAAENGHKEAQRMISVRKGFDVHMDFKNLYEDDEDPVKTDANRTKWYSDDYLRYER